LSEYNIPMPESKTYHPQLLPRRGELTAWALTCLAALGLYFLSLPGPLPTWAWIFFALLAFSAGSISLGNWMDRKTFIRLEPEGVTFENGLRKTHFTWDDIKEVRTSPARWGTSVQVLGGRAYFAFSTLGEMRFRGETRGQTGFAEGQFILKEILRQAGLTTGTQAGQFCTYSRD
jgi:hypothetical protein